MAFSSTGNDLAAIVAKTATDGFVAKDELTSMLVPSARPRFLAACAEIEKGFTAGCETDPCLEDGCSCKGEICLQPLLRAEHDYLVACGREWAKLFAEEENRDPLWPTSEIAVWHRWAQNLVA